MRIHVTPPARHLFRIRSDGKRPSHFQACHSEPGAKPGEEPALCRPPGAPFLASFARKPALSGAEGWGFSLHRKNAPITSFAAAEPASAKLPTPRDTSHTSTASSGSRIKLQPLQPLHHPHRKHIPGPYRPSVSHQSINVLRAIRPLSMIVRPKAEGPVLARHVRRLNLHPPEIKTPPRVHNIVITLAVSPRLGHHKPKPHPLSNKLRLSNLPQLLRSKSQLCSCGSSLCGLSPCGTDTPVRCL